MIIFTHAHTNDYVILLYICQRNLVLTYLGMIASRQKAAENIQQIKNSGIYSHKLQNIHTPIGLNIAETIENNVRRKIIKEHLLDPAFFDKMSILLAALIKERKQNALSYEVYLKKIAALATQVNEGKGDDTPQVLKTPAQRALYHNLDQDEDLAIRIDQAVKHSKRDDWRGNLSKEREIKAELYKILDDVDKVESIFKVIREQKEY